MKKWVLIIELILALSLLSPALPAGAQEGEPDGPVYIVQEGDSLWDIAVRFRISLEDLAQANGIADPNQIDVGDRLVIPGLEGVQGVLVTRQVPYGENLRSLSRTHAIPAEKLAQLNHITSPEELYAGYTLVIPEASEGQTGFSRSALSVGQSLLELAVLSDANPWSLVLANQLPGASAALPGDTLISPGGEQGFTGFLNYIAEGSRHYKVSLEKFVGRNFYNIFEYFSPGNLPLLFQLKALKKHMPTPAAFSRMSG